MQITKMIQSGKSKASHQQKRQADGLEFDNEQARHALGSALIWAMNYFRNKELNAQITEIGTKKFSESMLGYFKNKKLVISEKAALEALFKDFRKCQENLPDFEHTPIGKKYPFNS